MGMAVKNKSKGMLRKIREKKKKGDGMMHDGGLSEIVRLDLLLN